MDPDATLEEMLAEARADQSEFHEGIHRLAELVLALDEWLRKGGPLPEAWSAQVCDLCPHEAPHTRGFDHRPVGNI